MCNQIVSTDLKQFSVFFDIEKNNENTIFHSIMVVNKQTTAFQDKLILFIFPSFRLFSEVIFNIQGQQPQVALILSNFLCYWKAYGYKTENLGSSPRYHVVTIAEVLYSDIHGEIADFLCFCRAGTSSVSSFKKLRKSDIPETTFFCIKNRD